MVAALDSASRIARICARLTIRPHDGARSALVGQLAAVLDAGPWLMVSAAPLPVE
ncbi:MAG TPA: hypothetical protein VI011_01360 [Asanoa sp.]